MHSLHFSLINPETMVVLGISANSRIISMAIIDNGVLLDHRVHLFKEQWSESKAIRMIQTIQAFLSDFPITSIAILLPHVHYVTTQTKELFTRIQEYLSSQEYAISFYKASALHSLYETSKTKKKALMKALTIKYPDLRHVYRKELQNKNKHYHKLFEAVGAATLLEQSY